MTIPRLGSSAHSNIRTAPSSRVAVDFPFGHARPAGQVHVKHGAAAGRIREVHRAAEPGDDLPHDAQPQAGAALAARVGGVGLREFVEHVRPKIGRNSRTVVAHADAD